MAPTEIPSFALCAQTCGGNPEKDCLTYDDLATMTGARWRETMRGSCHIADTVLAEWDMSTRASLEAGKRQVFWYVPPCLHAIELALCLSMARSSATYEIFRYEMDAGLPHYALPSKIRVDDRLTEDNCGARRALFRMQRLLEWLKACAADEVRIPGMERTEMTSLHSGPWTAMHFDIPYLDRRVYELESKGSRGSFTMQTVVAATPHPERITGNLIICGGDEVQFFAGGSTHEDDIDLHPQPGRMFQLMPHGSDWTVTYFGNFTTSRP